MRHSSRRFPIYPHNPRPVVPFRIVDSRGAPCGSYCNLIDADRALDFLNQHGNHAPYTLAPEAPTWNPEAVA